MNYSDFTRGMKGAQPLPLWHYPVKPSIDTELPHEPQAPLIDPILPLVNHKAISIMVIEEVKDYIELQITGVDKDGLKAIREAMGHLPVMAIKEVNVKQNDTLLEIEPIKVIIKSIPLDVDANDYAGGAAPLPTRSNYNNNYNKPDVIHLFMYHKAYSGPQDNNKNIWLNNQLPLKKITSGNLLMVDMIKKEKSIKNDNDSGGWKGRSPSCTEDNDDESSYAFDGDEKSTVQPFKCISYRKPGQNYPELFKFRTPENIIPTRSANNPFIDPNSPPKLILFATAVKGCEYEDPGNREFAIYSKCSFDQMLEFQTLNKTQRRLKLKKKLKDTLAVLKNKDNPQEMKDEHDLMLGSNWEHKLDETRRELAQQDLMNCELNAAYIASRCPNQVFDIEEAIKTNKLVVQAANQCDRCDMCVRADITETLYYRPRKDHVMRFMLQTIGPHSAAYVLMNAIKWVATQSFESWINATQVTPTPMTKQVHPEYPTTNPKFNHLIGPPANMFAYQQVQSMWRIMKQDPNWQRCLNNRTEMSGLPSRHPVNNNNTIDKPYY